MDLWVMWRTVAQLAGAQPVSLDRVPRWTMRRADSGDDIVIDLTDDHDDVLGWDRDALARAADL
jgi:hypothetical protein